MAVLENCYALKVRETRIYVLVKTYTDEDFILKFNKIEIFIFNMIIVLQIFFFQIYTILLRLF